MKVNGIDARVYNAKQLTAEVLPPSLNVDYEMLTGAVLPVEFDTDMTLGKLKLCMYFRGKDRNDLIRKMSAFLKNFTKSSEIEVDGYKGKFRAYTTSSSYTKMKVANRYQLNIEADGYFFDDEIKLKYDGVTSATIKRKGTRKTPAIIEVYAEKTLKDYTIDGLEDPITVKELAAGKTMTIDGEKGRVMIDGTDAFNDVDLWKFPALTNGETELTLTNTDAVITVRYKPMWI